MICKVGRAPPPKLTRTRRKPIDTKDGRISRSMIPSSCKLCPLNEKVGRKAHRQTRIYHGIKHPIIARMALTASVVTQAWGDRGVCCNKLPEFGIYAAIPSGKNAVAEYSVLRIKCRCRDRATDGIAWEAIDWRLSRLGLCQAKRGIICDHFIQENCCRGAGRSSRRVAGNV